MIGGNGRLLTAPELAIVEGFARVGALYGEDVVAHQSASAALAERLALALDLDEVTVQRCAVAARVHDLGLLAVDRRILTAPAMLTEARRAAMMAHPVEGARILRSIPALAAVSQIVETHHERFDGRGYPHGLRATEIPIESRILAIADAFHNMTVPQSYRQQLLPAEAMAEIADNAGTQFDADLVDPFVRLLQRGR